MSIVRWRLVAISVAAHALLLCGIAHANEDYTAIDEAVAVIQNVSAVDFPAADRDIRKALSRVGMKPAYDEVIEALLARLTKELGNPIPGFGLRLFKIIGEYVPNVYFSKVEKIHREFVSGAKNLDGRHESALVEDLERVAENYSLVINVKVGRHFARQKSLGYGPALKQFTQNVEMYLKGQPEVVQSFADIRGKDLLYGTRTKAPNIWLMGVGGSGQDTAAKAYVNAIWGDENAHREHLLKISPVTNESDYGGLVGSGTGYIGSDNFPPLLNFLLKHSCGRYTRQSVQAQTGAISFRVVETQKWKPNPNDPNCPENAVIYVDNFHSWAERYKDQVIKPALDDQGMFIIRNPNGGLDRIFVPVTIIIASKDGIELFTSRERNGQRFGEPETYEQMSRKYDRVNNNQEVLRKSILSGNGDANARRSEDSRGTSAEFLKSVDRYVAMRPLSPELLRDIADQKVQEKLKMISNGKGDFRNVRLTYSPAVLRLIQEYEYIAEDNASQIDAKVGKLFEAPLMKALADGHIQSKTRAVHFDLKKNDDGTYSLDAKIDGIRQNVQIAETMSQREQEPPTDDEIIELGKISEKLKTHVVGQDDTLVQIGRAIFLSEGSRKGQKKVSNAKTPARAFMLLGWTSVGKTETSKALAEVLMGDRQAARVYSFTPGTTEYDLKSKILGIDDGSGRCIPSDFMKAHDKFDGRLIVVLDEIANIRDKNLLNMLYDFLREPVVYLCGKAYVMANVTVLMTGNAGQEIMMDLPSDLPDVVRRAAMREAHSMMQVSPNVRRDIYEKYFSPAFLGRVGDKRIFNYAPLEYLPAAELFQLKIKEALKDLKPKSGERGWNIAFTSEQNFRQIIDNFEREGFEVREQGASVDRFVSENFKGYLHELLLSNLVPSGSDVTIEFIGVQSAQVKNPEMPEQNELLLKVSTTKGVFDLKLLGRQVEREKKRLVEDIILTSFHEAGHAIVTKAYFEDFQEPKYIKILPGVTRIMERWIYYAGIATSDEKVRLEHSLESILREIAVLMGGAVAEELIVKGGISLQGKSNDIERATRLAKIAILKIGVTPEWGMRVEEESNLSERDKVKLARLVDQMLKDGYEMAKEAIMANPDTLLTMGNQLARQGILNREELQKIFRETKMKVEGRDDLAKAAKENEKFFETEKNQSVRTRGLRFEFTDKMNIVELADVFDLEGGLESQRTAEIAKLKLDKAIPFGHVSAQSPETLPKDGIPVLTDVYIPKNTQTQVLKLPHGRCELDLRTR